MNSPSNPNLSDEILRRIDQACDEFESAWKAGDRPFVDDVLGDFPDNAQGVLLNELLPIEIAWRQKSGESPTVDSYLFRFPQLHQALLKSLLHPASNTDTNDDEGTLAISGTFSGIETPANFDSEFISTEGSELSFDNLSVESAELARDFDTLGILEARVILSTLAASGRPLNELSKSETVSLLSEKSLLSRWQTERLTSAAPESLVLGDYVLIEPLGKGGMGIVYRARHRRMDRLVALKTLTSQATGSDDSVQRFQREVRAAARLSHPNIVAAYDAGEHNDTHYLVMELVDGIDLARLVRQSGPLNASTAVNYVRQAATGFAYAHSQGIIHRDIKPQNLLVDRKQHVRILDMGLARLTSVNAASEPIASAGQPELTQSGVIMGTVDFMSPEQATNTRNANERSDIYSLGCTLYFLITGRAMFDGETCMERLLAHHQESRPSLITTVSKIPPALDEVFARMTARNPADRYATMEEVVDALERVQTTLEVPASATGSHTSAASAVAKLKTEPAAASSTASGPNEPDLNSPEPTFITHPAEVTRLDNLNPAPSTAHSETSRSPVVRSKVVRFATIVLGLCIVIWSVWPDRDKASDTDNGNSSNNNTIGVLNSLTLLTDRPQPDCDWPQASQIQQQQRQVAAEFGITPFVENSIGMVLAVVPASDAGTKPFLIGTTEVTVHQFGLFFDETGYELRSSSRWGHEGERGWQSGAEYNFRNIGDLPVSPEFPACSICWFDAQAFCDWLSERENARYRLPTITEWQTANAAGNSARWFFGDNDDRLTDFAWYQVNSGQEFHNVAGKRPNALGIFDTLGNEYEWCLGTASGQTRQQFQPQIGGGFGDSADEIVRRIHDPNLVPADRGLHGAFRIVREL